MDSLDAIEVCTHYEVDGERIDEFPGELSQLEKCKPAYQTVPGWKSSTMGVSRVEDLPKNARAYLETLEELCRTPVELVSTGQERDATITGMNHRGGPVLDRWFGTFR